MAKILVIDDEEDVRVLLERILTRAGHEVKVAADGNDALEKVENDKFDLVITDIIMPGKDGLETMLNIRSLQPDIVFIAISGGDTIPAEYHLRAAGMLGVAQSFTKPFNNKELLAAIENLTNPA